MNLPLRWSVAIPRYSWVLWWRKGTPEARVVGRVHTNISSRGRCPGELPRFLPRYSAHGCWGDPPAFLDECPTPAMARAVAFNYACNMLEAVAITALGRR